MAVDHCSIAAHLLNPVSVKLISPHGPISDELHCIPIKRNTLT